MKSFFEFSKRVMEAAKKGGLPISDIKKLDKLLLKTGKKNTIFSKGLITALSIGNANSTDLRRFKEIIGSAELRLFDSKEPFTTDEKKEISQIFNRSYLPQKTARWISLEMDGLLAEELANLIEGKSTIPIKLDKKEDKKKLNVV